MIDFGTLIIAHLVGDYVLQNDWMAQNKQGGIRACLTHCILYTVAGMLVVGAQGVLWPVWAWLVVFGAHVAIDYTGFAKTKLMGWLGQAGFRDNLGPWSAIIIDNTLHLLTYFAVWAALGG